MKAAILDFDLFNLSLKYLQSGDSKRFNIELLTFGGYFGRSLFRFSVDSYKGNPVTNIRIHLFYFILFDRQVSYKPNTDSYVVDRKGLFA